MHELTGANSARRKFLCTSAAFSLIGITGCCHLFRSGIPQARIKDEIPLGLNPILKPSRISPNKVKSYVVDVHAHFFNARDVNVEGYLAGPVAHSRSGSTGKLLKRISKIAGWISRRAPTAEDEFKMLLSMASAKSLVPENAMNRKQALYDYRESYLREVSKDFYEQMKNDDVFILQYNEELAKERAESGGEGFVGSPSFNEDSLFLAIQSDVERLGSTSQSFTLDSRVHYPGGALAFVGYMLSYRWMNLLAYQKAYSSDLNTFGVNQVLGALVDFNYWLPPFAKTAPEDQIRLHELISKLSGGYMRPIVAYNPWSDLQDKGATLTRVLDALDNRGFVGVKIYPPNGFRPYGNGKEPLETTIKDYPNPQLLDEVLKQLWIECNNRGVPVMAHSGKSMGRDDGHDRASEPYGWLQLVDSIGSKSPVRVNLGHFGGDSNREWNDGFATLMNSPEGKNIYGDLGFWENKGCKTPKENCIAQTLSELISKHPVLKSRLMYGSDWLMLSQEKHWADYPNAILESLPKGVDAKAIFGGNAFNCFTRLEKTEFGD